MRKKTVIRQMEVSPIIPHTNAPPGLGVIIGSCLPNKSWWQNNNEMICQKLKTHI